MPADARDRFLSLVRTAVDDRTLVKLTLGKYRAADPTLRNLFIRPTELKAGSHLMFVYRHGTSDVTKNFAPDAGVAEIIRLVGTDFLDAHLFTTTQTAQLETQPDARPRLRITAAKPAASNRPPVAHDRPKQHLIPADAPWLRALGVMNDRGQPRVGMADKFRQIEKYTELLSHLAAEADLLPGAEADATRPLRVIDMGCGKGYLTFAVAALLGASAETRGIEARSELVAFCNRVASETGFAPRLNFTAGTIADTAVGGCDVLIALHACDTATDDALARGIGAGARLVVVAPCCHKELRPQLKSPSVLAPALQHGIFQERQAEFVTDALRAELLEWAGYRTKVFEFISTEHTAKNLMIAGVKTTRTPAAESAARIREFAQFYGIRSQRLAQHLGVSLLPERNLVPGT